MRWYWAYANVLQGEEELDQNEKKKLRKLKAVEESDDEEEGKEGHGASLFAAFYACDTRRTSTHWRHTTFMLIELFCNIYCFLCYVFSECIGPLKIKVNVFRFIWWFRDVFFLPSFFLPPDNLIFSVPSFPSLSAFSFLNLSLNLIRNSWRSVWNYFFYYLLVARLIKRNFLILMSKKLFDFIYMQR